MSSRPFITLIVAMSHNRVIGRSGRLPWHLPADLKRFKQRTMGNAVIMGRLTWESIPEKFRPLPGRTNIVVTSNAAYQAPGATVARTIEDACRAAFAAHPQAQEVFIIGGGETYQSALPLADRIELTHIDAHIDGDTYFPEFEGDYMWRLVGEEPHPADAHHAYAFSFRTYKKRK